MALAKEGIVETVRNSMEDPVYSYKNQDKFNKNKCRSCVESILEIIKETLEKGEDVLISRFGKFYVKEKRERRGRNPWTGDSMQVEARRIVSFKCSEKLRNQIDSKHKT